MVQILEQWPGGIYPGEILAECPEAEATIDVLIERMKIEGPNPHGYQVKLLGRRRGSLWQLNLKVEKRQVRILYAPYNEKIVIFRIHKKSSPQEQERAYDLAQSRKRDYERRHFH
jgi:hypothetical protein